MTPAENRANHIRWLKFAILLCRTDLDGLTAGQRLDIENEFQKFLESVLPDPRNASRLFNLLKDQGGLPPALAFLMTKKATIDLKRAKEILTNTLISLAAGSVLTFHKGPAEMLLWRVLDSFHFVVSPEDVDQRIIAILGYHLTSAGIPASWLRRCPQCNEIFLANQKPRPDRKLHCSLRCSANAASNAFRKRQKKLVQAKKLRQAGRGIDWIVRHTGLTREYLKQRKIV